MANLKTFPHYILKNNEITVFLTKDDDEMEIEDKDFYIQLTRINGIELYEEEHTIKSKINLHNGIYSVNFKITIPNGIYLLIGYYYKNDIKTIVKYTAQIESTRAIEIYEDERKYNEKDIKDLKDKVIRKYLEKQSKGLGIQEIHNIAYKGYSFIINAYIGKNIDLGTAKLIPIQRLDNTYLSKYMADVLVSEEIVPILNINEKETSFDDPYGQPGVLLEVKNIYAPNIESASKLLMEYTERTVKSLSLLNDSHGEIIGNVLIDSISGRVSYRTVVFPYLGNLFVGMENPKEIKTIQENITDFLSDYYVTLYLEAMKERNLDIKRLKYWTILETIAKNKGYSKLYQTRLDGSEIKDKNGKRIRIKDHGLANVRELLIKYFEKTGKTINITDDQLSVWYQERNCTAHKGKCVYEDTTYCNSRNNSYKMCRKYEASIRNGNIRNIDTENFTLKYLIKNIIKFEISKSI